MNEHLTGPDQSVILLTQPMGELEKGLEVLTTEELSALEDHVAAQGYNLGYILSPAGQHAFTDMPNAEQINSLLSRSFIVGMKAKQWTDHQITVLCRTNPRYPQRVLERMGQEAPPVLYCMGPAEIINDVQIAVRLPWEVGPDFHKYASQLGQGLQKLGAVTATGGDTYHEKTLIGTANSQTSTAVGIVRTGLIRAAAERAYKQAISRERVLLISAQSPENEEPPEPHDHHITESIIHSISGRTMIAMDTIPPTWQWSDLMPAPEQEEEAGQPMSGNIYLRPRRDQAYDAP